MPRSELATIYLDGHLNITPGKDGLVFKATTESETMPAPTEIKWGIYPPISVYLDKQLIIIYGKDGLGRKLISDVVQPEPEIVWHDELPIFDYVFGKHQFVAENVGTIIPVLWATGVDIVTIEPAAAVANLSAPATQITVGIAVEPTTAMTQFYAPSPNVTVGIAVEPAHGLVQLSGLITAVSAAGIAVKPIPAMTYLSAPVASIKLITTILRITFRSVDEVKMTFASTDEIEFTLLGTDELRYTFKGGG